MKSLILWTVTLAMTVTSPAWSDDAKKEMEKLQGTWKPVSYEVAGNKIDGVALESIVVAIAIKGDNYEWKVGDGATKGKVKIDAGKNPKHIDFIMEPDAGVKLTAWSGVYDITGDTLRFCMGAPTAARPKEISNKSLTHALLTLKRAK